MKKVVLFAAATVVAAVIGVLALGSAAASHINSVTIDSVTRNGDGTVTVEGTLTCTFGGLDDAAGLDVTVASGTNNGSASDAYGTYDCSGATVTFDWSHTITGDEGPFSPQDEVHVTAEASCCAAPGGFSFTEGDFGFNNAGGNDNLDNTCANSGAGNGIEVVEDGECEKGIDPGDDGEQTEGDADPGNSGANNKVPASAPRRP